MKNKFFWFDCETTGLDPSRHAIIQLSGLIELEGRIQREFDLRMRPRGNQAIDLEALTIHGYELSTLKTFDSQSRGFKRLIEILSYFVDRYEKTDKFILAGYNINSFDEPFLREFFSINKDKYFGSWFAWPKLDVQSYVAEHIAAGNLYLPNYKLQTLCDHYGIQIDAHDALSDIRATRTLFQVLKYSLPMPLKEAA